MKEAAVVTAFLEKLWREEAKPLDPFQRQRLDALHAELTSHPAPQFPRLAVRRLLASNTLRGGDRAARTCWDHANQELAAAITEKIPVTVSLAARLNFLLTSLTHPRPKVNRNEISPLRTYPLFGAEGEYLPPELVPAQAALLDKRLSRSHGDPLQDAFVAYAGLVTIHPFSSGNGRTSRLLADAILLANGWLPISFPSPVQSHVAQSIGGMQRSTEGAYATFLRGMIFSYESTLSDANDAYREQE